MSRDFRLLSSASNGAWENLQIPTFEASTNGKLEVFVFNESNVNVWFDDMQIQHIPTLISQENHYYAFGMNAKEVEKEGSNLFQYNSKEKESFQGLEWNDYGARSYDSEACRWWGVDAKAEKYFHFSIYHTCGNNPINNYDLDGNEFTPAANRWIANLQDRMETDIGSYNRKIARLTERLNETTNLKKQEKLRRKIDGVTARRDAKNADYDVVRNEIEVLRNSTQVYNVVESDNLNREGKEGAAASFNRITNTIDIIIGRDSHIGLFAHELKHAFQFETGTTSLTSHTINNQGTIRFDRPRNWQAYDLQDEVEAYQRQNLFGVRSPNNWRAEYNNRTLNGVVFPQQQNTLNSLGLINQTPIQLQNQAVNDIMNFRLNGVTYTQRR